MIKGALLGLSLALTTAFEPDLPPQAPDASRMQMTVRQKNAVIQPLMRAATDCVADAVAGNPRFRIGMEPSHINELIVLSIESCVGPIRALIDAYDRLFGEGSGEAFFMGPYLEVLPKAVARQVKGNMP